MASIFDDPRFQQHQRKLDVKAQGGVRVLGGIAVPPGEFMDCVAVGCGPTWACTGTLIAPNVVLTAAHCTSCAAFVFFGQDARNIRPDTPDHPAIVAVKKAITHAGYSGRENDLMVLILAKSVNVPPRRLATAAQIDAAEDGRVVGFGRVDAQGKKKHGEKRMTDVPIASHACEGRVGDSPDDSVYGCATGLEIVAKREGRVLKDTCHGDSGGPLYVLDEAGEWRLAGATSRATDGGRDCGDGGIYERLDRYKAWIEHVAGVQL